MYNYISNKVSKLNKVNMFLNECNYKNWHDKKEKLVNT